MSANEFSGLEEEIENLSNASSIHTSSPGSREEDEENTGSREDDEENSPSEDSSQNSNTCVLECAEEIRENLISTAEMERLRDLADVRLSESGWKTDMTNILRAEIRKRNPDFKFKTLFDLLMDTGRDKVPSRIQDELTEKIQNFFETNICSEEGSYSGSAEDN